MKKVIFSVIRAGRNESRMSGVGYITETDLLIPAISKNGKAYIRVFEDCIKHCHKIANENELYFEYGLILRRNILLITFNFRLSS